MVEPLFRIDSVAGIRAGDSVTLGGSEGKHAVSVRRMRTGEAIQLTDGQGARLRGVVDSVAEKSLNVRVASIETEALPTTQLVLIQALAKGDRDELAIQAATELGAWAIVPWQAERSISRWDASKANKGVERWQTIVSEAAKQSLRVWEPKVHAPVSTKQLAAQIADFDRVLVLDPTATAPISALSGLAGKVAIVVGPEGGISDGELAELEAAGSTRVRLGAEILRTSTAGVAAIAVLQASLGAWA